MTHLKLTPAEGKAPGGRLCRSGTGHGPEREQNAAKSGKTAGERVLRAIQDEREARRAQEMRREKYEAAETTFTWQPLRRR
ncbi:Uncharacterised protein [Klebsiella pneumoniae]|uniref:Uncharacterized protein n=1 Tax=Klebsiella pneumoniae TaxID=573 RepID=A0A377WA89_KLEPN|nr:Uncharacterised protein [Klebsiella pneumoniae]